MPSREPGVAFSGVLSTTLSDMAKKSHETDLSHSCFYSQRCLLRYEKGEGKSSHVLCICHLLVIV